MARVKFWESEREIEKMFQQDIREKKRTGSGAFHRTGKGAKHGIIGGMRTHADMLKGKAKREYTKPGELKVYNLNDIISRQDFEAKTENEKKELLIRWRENYPNETILEKSGIPKKDYYDYVRKFGIKHNKGGNMGVNKKTYSPEEIQAFKENVIDFETFLTLDGEQKAEVFEHYDANFTTKELTELWDVKDSHVYSHRGNVKKFRERQNKQKTDETRLAMQMIKAAEKKEDEKASKLPENEPETIQAALPLNEPETVQDEPETIAEEPKVERVFIEPGKGIQELIENEVMTMAFAGTEIAAKPKNKVQKFRIMKPKKEPLTIPEPEATGTTYRVNGVYSSDELSERLDKINLLISGENADFEINLTITEKPISETKQDNENKDKIQHVMAALAELIK